MTGRQAAGHHQIIDIAADGPAGPGPARRRLIRGVLDFLASFFNVLTGAANRVARAQRKSRQGNHKTKSQSLHGTNLHLQNR